jgi:hypothetical protein
MCTTADLEELPWIYPVVFTSRKTARRTFPVLLLAVLPKQHNYGYPKMNSVGVGIEKLSHLNYLFSFRSSVYY